MHSVLQALLDSDCSRLPKVLHHLILDYHFVPLQGNLERVLTGHNGRVPCVAMLAGGRIVSGSFDKTLRIWNVRTGVCDLVLEGHSHAVLCVCVTPNEEIVSGSFDYSLRVWSTRSKACQRELRGHSGVVQTVLTLPDGRVASSSSDGTIRVWNIITGVCESMLSGTVTCLISLPDGQLMSGHDGKLKIWTTQSPQVHDVRGKVNAILPQSQSKRFVVATTAAFQTVPGTILGMRWTPGNIQCMKLFGNNIVTGDIDGNVQIWKEKAPGKYQELPETYAREHSTAITCLEVLPDGRIITGSLDNTMRVWSKDLKRSDLVMSKHKSAVLFIVAYSDGMVVSGSDDGTLCVWH